MRQLSSADQSVLDVLRRKAPAVSLKAKELTPEFLPGFIDGAKHFLQADQISLGAQSQLQSLLTTHLQKQNDEDSALDTRSVRLARPGAIRNLH